MNGTINLSVAQVTKLKLPSLSFPTPSYHVLSILQSTYLYCLILLYGDIAKCGPTLTSSLNDATASLLGSPLPLSPHPNVFATLQSGALPIIEMHHVSLLKILQQFPKALKIKTKLC